MPPKKTAVDSNVGDTARDAPMEEETDKKTAVRKPATHPSTVLMVNEAIKALDSRKGVSPQAIKKYILEKYPLVDVVRLTRLVRNVLVKGLENGTLVRPANSAVTSAGAVGRFKLAPKVKESKPKMENADPNVQDVPEDAVKDDVKKPKKAGATKKTTTSGKKKSSEDSTRPKKSKGEAAAATSKVPPAKKPKAKKTGAEEAGETTKSTKPKGGKMAPKGKAAEEVGDAPSKATGKRGKKTVE